MEGMGEVKKQINKPLQEIQVTSEKNKEDSVYDLNKSELIQPEEQINFEKEKDSALDIMVKNSMDANLQLKERQSVLLTVEDKWKAYDEYRKLPVQKIPEARSTQKARKTEAGALKKAQKTFSFADTCTVREMDNLKAHIKFLQDGKKSEITGQDGADNESLLSFVSDIVSLDMSEKYLTDDYLSDHIGEMLEYCKKLEMFGELRDKYPKFFSSIPDSHLMILEERSDMAKDLKGLLNSHLELHGINVEYQDGDPGAVTLKEVKGKSAQERSQNEENHEKAKDAYDKQWKEFYVKNIEEAGLNNAARYTRGKAYSSEVAAPRLFARISQLNKDVPWVKESIDAAKEEITRSFQKRDELITALKDNLKKYGECKTAEEVSARIHMIVDLNARIRKITTDADKLIDSLNIQEELKVNETTRDAVKAMEDRKEDGGNDSASMKEFSAAMNAIYNFLGQKMPPLSFDDEAIDAGCLLAVNIYNRAEKSIDKCLNKPENYNNSEEIKKQLQDARELCKKERSLFRQNVFELRDLIKTQQLKLAKPLTWADALKYQRSVKLNVNGEDGVNMKKIGAGSSTIYKFDYEGKSVFFRKGEVVPPKDNQEFVKYFLDKTMAEGSFMERTLRPIFEIFGKEKTINGKTMTDFFKPMRRNSSEEIFDAVLKSDSKAKEFLKNIKDKDEIKKVGSYLTEFARSVFQRDFCKGAHIGYGKPLSERNVATSRMALILGIPGMIAESRTALMRDGDKVELGNLMEDTKGEEVTELVKEARKNDGKVSYSDEAISQLYTIQIFDLLCQQMDRHFGNYHAITERKNGQIIVKKIKGIDNDIAFGTIKYERLKNGLNRIRPITNENIKGMPIAFLNAVMNLNDDVAANSLCDILDAKEIKAFKERLNGLRNDIKNAMGDIGLKRDVTGSADGFAGRYYYEGEEQDDTLRQLLQLKKQYEILDSSPNQQLLGDVSVFHEGVIGQGEIKRRIKERREQLKQQNQN